MKSIREQIEAGHIECMRCINDFIRFGGQFAPEVCKCCNHGRMLHELEVQSSNSEKEWGACDWNSIKYSDFYRD